MVSRLKMFMTEYLSNLLWTSPKKHKLILPLCSIQKR
jgi:hypothetical protein